MTAQTQDEKDSKAIRRAIVGLVEAVRAAEEHGLSVAISEFSHEITPGNLRAAIVRAL